MFYCGDCGQRLDFGDEERTQKGGCSPKRKRDKAEENKILSEEAKKAGWKSGVMNI